MNKKRTKTKQEKALSNSSCNDKNNVCRYCSMIKSEENIPEHRTKIYIKY